MRFLGSLTVLMTVVCLAGVSLAQDGRPALSRQDPKPADQPTTAPSTGRVYVMMTTSEGDITLELNAAKAPMSVANFMAYADRGYYDGTIFHRVIDGFMIQGGGFTPDLQKKPTDPPIENEWKNGLKNKKGTIAFARTTQPHSATSQFFINVGDNVNLDKPISGGAGYAVFGKVVDGMDVVDAIRRTTTTTQGRYRDVPAEPIMIERVVRISPSDAKTKVKEAAGEGATTKPSSPKDKDRTKK